MLRRVLVFLSLIGSVEMLYAQCGTELTFEQEQFMETLQTSPVLARSDDTGSIGVPVKFYIIRRSDGTGGLNPDRVDELLTDLSAIYAPASISFFEGEPTAFIDSNTFYDLDAGQEEDLAGPRDKAGLINIYVSGSLSSGASGLCGYTRFPPSADRVFLAMGCTNDVATIAHELGHYFTLYHTHGKSNNGTTDELVSRVNCEILGDDLCDTAADPNLSGRVSGSCQYTGTAIDGEGKLFVPDPTNIMSYSLNRCMNWLTTGQLDRTRAGLEQGRDYLNLQYDGFTARFTSSGRVGCTPLTVEFEDRTVGVTSRVWTFQGAILETSFSANPTVNYTEPGDYKVILEARNSAGDVSISERTAYVKAEDPYKDIVYLDEEENFMTDELRESWIIYNQDREETFSIVNVSFDDGSNCIYMPNYSYEAATFPRMDALEITNVSIREFRSVVLNFNYAYAYKSEGVYPELVERFDTLELGYKYDCGDNWEAIWRKGGEDLSTVSGQAGEFEPSSQSDWTNIEIELSQQELVGKGNSEVLNLEFRNISYNGNNLYIDNVFVSPDFSLENVSFFRVVTWDQESVELRWFNPNTNELGTQIQRSIDGAEFVSIDSVGVDVTEYLDDPPQGAKEVSYRIASYNSVAISELSDVVSQVVTGISEHVYANDLVISPNPVEGDEFRMDYSGVVDIEQIQIYDMSGRHIMSPTPSRSVYLESSRLESGLYLVSYLLENGVVFSKKVLINH